MKKLMIAAAALACGSALADITSANIVGYNTKAADAGKFIILGAQFEGVAGGTKINDLINGVEGVDYGDGTAFLLTAPQIQVPVAGGYNIYYYLNDGWFDDGTAEGATKAGWCDGVGNIVEAEVTPGVAVWLKSIGANAVVNVSGAVSSLDTISVDCPAAFALRANAFPLEITLNGSQMACTGIAAVDYGDGQAFLATAPQIQVPVTGGYSIYYYLSDGWYDDGTAEGATKAGWCDGVGNIVQDKIASAQGFWTKGVGSAFTLTFNK